MLNATPIFIPGLICTADLFRDQLTGLSTFENRNAPVVADTISYDSISAMAAAALDSVEGPVIPIGLSMGGYVAQEMANQAPDRVAGLALLNTNYQADNDAKQKQRQSTIALAKSDKFKGVTRHLLKSFLSPSAMEDNDLIDRVVAMANDVGAAGFVRQQTAILGRRDQSQTLQKLEMPVLVLCGMLDTVTPPHLSRDMADLAPESELVLLEEVGHLSSLEAPAAVTAALNAFLARL